MELLLGGILVGLLLGGVGGGAILWFAWRVTRNQDTTGEDRRTRFTVDVYESQM